MESQDHTAISFCDGCPHADLQSGYAPDVFHVGLSASNVCVGLKLEDLHCDLLSLRLRLN